MSTTAATDLANALAAAVNQELAASSQVVANATAAIDAASAMISDIGTAPKQTGGVCGQMYDQLVQSAGTLATELADVGSKSDTVQTDISIVRADLTPITQIASFIDQQSNIIEQIKAAIQTGYDMLGDSTLSPSQRQQITAKIASSKDKLLGVQQTLYTEQFDQKKRLDTLKTARASFNTDSTALKTATTKLTTDTAAAKTLFNTYMSTCFQLPKSDDSNNNNSTDSTGSSSSGSGSSSSGQAQSGLAQSGLAQSGLSI